MAYTVNPDLNMVIGNGYMKSGTYTCAAGVVTVTTGLKKIYFAWTEHDTAAVVGSVVTAGDIAIAAAGSETGRWFAIGTV
jgi:hypothetical protein